MERAHGIRAPSRQAIGVKDKEECAHSAKPKSSVNMRECARVLQASVEDLDGQHRNADK